MPGYLYTARCSCRYNEGLKTGYNVRSKVGYCIVYSASEPKLETCETNRAEREGLMILPDPGLDVEETNRLPDKSWVQSFGYYTCPSCKEESLVFTKNGHWD